MGRPKGPPKSPWEAVPMEWRDAVMGMSREEIEARIVEVSSNDIELRKLKKEDQALQEAAFAHKEAGAVYREGAKVNRLKIEFAQECLTAKGGQTKSG